MHPLTPHASTRKLTKSAVCENASKSVKMPHAWGWVVYAHVKNLQRIPVIKCGTFSKFHMARKCMHGWRFFVKNLKNGRKPGGGVGGGGGGSKTTVFRSGKSTTIRRFSCTLFPSIVQTPEKGGKSALWSPFFGYSQGVPPEHSFRLCYLKGVS